MAAVPLAAAGVILGTPGFASADMWFVMGVLVLVLVGFAVAMLRDERRREREREREEAEAAARAMLEPHDSDPLPHP